MRWQSEKFDFTEWIILLHEHSEHCYTLQQIILCSAFQVCINISYGQRAHLFALPYLLKSSLTRAACDYASANLSILVIKYIYIKKTLLVRSSCSSLDVSLLMKTYWLIDELMTECWGKMCDFCSISCGGFVYIFCWTGCDLEKTALWSALMPCYVIVRKAEVLGFIFYLPS